MEKQCFEYGAMSSRYRLYADNKLTAYAAMVLHYNSAAHMVALYEPEEVVKKDSWLNPFGQISRRLDEIFGGEGAFDKYINAHVDEVREAYQSIEQIC